MLLTPPESFEGLISTFVDSHVVPNFPQADALCNWTEALLSYYTDGRDPVCVIRGPQRGVIRHHAGVRVVDSDNAPGIWS